MKLTQVKGNTWVLEGFELIPLYRLDNNKCILLDTGLEQEREDIENTLLEAGLTPTPTSTTREITAIFRRSTAFPWLSPPGRRACAPAFCP